MEHCQLPGTDALDMTGSSRGQGSSEEWSESDDPPQLVIDMAGKIRIEAEYTCLKGLFPE